MSRFVILRTLGIYSINVRTSIIIDVFTFAKYQLFKCYCLCIYFCLSLGYLRLDVLNILFLREAAKHSLTVLKRVVLRLKCWKGF